MKREVKRLAVELIRSHISDETSRINENKRQINKLADLNTMLKRLRTQHIQILNDFEKA
jgi:ribosomal protein S17E